jgi:hypothetical protein
MTDGSVIKKGGGGIMESKMIALIFASLLLGLGVGYGLEYASVANTIKDVKVTNFPNLPALWAVNVTNLSPQGKIINIVENLNLAWSFNYSAPINLTSLSVTNWKSMTVYMRVSNYTRAFSSISLGEVRLFVDSIFDYGTTSRSWGILWHNDASGNPIFSTFVYDFTEPNIRITVKGTEDYLNINESVTCLISVGIYLRNY